MSADRIDLPAKATLDLLMFENAETLGTSTLAGGAGDFQNACNKFPKMLFKFSKARFIRHFTGLSAADGSRLIGELPITTGARNITS